MTDHVRHIGDPIVPLTDVYARTVAFVIGSSGALGTGFLVQVPGVPGRFESYNFRYFVTAAHVVRGKGQTAMRANKDLVPREDGTVDIPVPEWYFHPDDDVDVAVAPITATDVWLTPVSQSAFADVPLAKRGKLNVAPADTREWRPGLGDRVYFLGLLGKVDDMTKRNIPMVRSGTVGALYQDGIPVRRPNQEMTFTTGHLIDCRSTSGFSGSPCFVQTERFGTRHDDGKPTLVDETWLLGLITGHFGDYEKVRSDDSVQELTGGQIASNNGVGVVTPVERIRETLNLEVLVKDRQRQHDELAASVEQQEAVIYDAAPEPAEPDAFDRFTDLTSKIVKVSKADIADERKPS